MALFFAGEAVLLEDARHVLRFFGADLDLHGGDRGSRGVSEIGRWMDRAEPGEDGVGRALWILESFPDLPQSFGEGRRVPVLFVDESCRAGISWPGGEVARTGHVSTGHGVLTLERVPVVVGGEEVGISFVQSTREELQTLLVAPREPQADASHDGVDHCVCELVVDHVRIVGKVAVSALEEHDGVVGTLDDAVEIASRHEHGVVEGVERAFRVGCLGQRGHDRQQVGAPSEGIEIHRQTPVRGREELPSAEVVEERRIESLEVFVDGHGVEEEIRFREEILPGFFVIVIEVLEASGVVVIVEIVFELVVWVLHVGGGVVGDRHVVFGAGVKIHATEHGDLDLDGLVVVPAGP